MTPSSRPVPSPTGTDHPGAVAVGVDGSPAATRALDLAVLLATRSGAALRVLHAYQRPVRVDAVPGVPSPVGVSAREAHALATARAHSWLALALERRAAAHPGSAPPVPVVVEVVEDAPGDLLVRAAADAAVLVVGRRAHGPLGSALLGSALAPVLHHAPCPVLVVPPDGTGPLPDDWPRRLVVGVDGSPAAGTALRWAAATGAPVVAVFAWAYDTVPDFPPVLTIPTDGDYAAAAARWLQAELDAVLPERPPVTPEVHRGRPGAVLQRLAGPQDLLVLGARTHGRLGGLRPAAVAAHCALHAAAPVLLVRPSTVSSTVPGELPDAVWARQGRTAVSTGA